MDVHELYNPKRQLATHRISHGNVCISEKKIQKRDKKPLDNMLNHQGELSKSHTLDESRYPQRVGVQRKIKTGCMVIFNKLYLT